MRTLRLFSLVLIVAFGLLGCANTSVTEYAKELPKFDMQAYFNGKVVAHGVVQDRGGKVIRRMRVDMLCTWVGDTGTLDEEFTYSDGKKEKRVWTIKKRGERYIGTAADVMGEALGESSGNALNWRYTLVQPYNDSTIELQFDDWMWQLDDKVMMNRAVFSKFGIRLGEVLITFIKS